MKIVITEKMMLAFSNVDSSHHAVLVFKKSFKKIYVSQRRNFIIPYTT